MRLLRPSQSVQCRSEFSGVTHSFNATTSNDLTEDRLITMIDAAMVTTLLQPNEHVLMSMEIYNVSVNDEVAVIVLLSDHVSTIIGHSTRRGSFALDHVDGKSTGPLRSALVFFDAEHANVTLHEREKPRVRARGQRERERPSSSSSHSSISSDKLDTVDRSRLRMSCRCRSELKGSMSFVHRTRAETHFEFQFQIGSVDQPVRTE